VFLVDQFRKFPYKAQNTYLVCNYLVVALAARSSLNDTSRRYERRSA